MSRFTIQEIIRIFVWSAVGLLLFTFGLWIWGTWHDEWSGYNASLSISDGYCNIAVVPIVGEIYIDEPTSDGSETPAVANADEVIAMIHNAEYDSRIEGVLVRIDSLGGTPVASELIANALKRSPLPVTAVIREYGTSGAYLAATGADVIFASAFSDIGSIGISMSYLENWKQNANNGLSFVPLTSAPLKDYGNPNKPLTTAERTLIERDLRIYHNHFVKEVSENRDIPIDEVEKLADGSSMPGALALENSLIDALGDQETARDWFAKQLDTSRDNIVFCE